MGAIFSKEIKSFFNSMLGYVFCAVMIILIGIYFTYIIFHMDIRDSHIHL